MAISRTRPITRLANTEAIMIKEAMPIFLNMEAVMVMAVLGCITAAGQRKGYRG
jgi:hypothetical protein